MGRVQAPVRRGRLILDAGALIALAHGDRRARAVLERALDERLFVQVPTPVLAQVHRGGPDHTRADRALTEVDEFVPTTEATARDAGELLGRTGLSDAIDAIVAAEAISAAPSVILTSDPVDISRLIEAGEGSRRVAVHRV